MTFDAFLGYVSIKRSVFLTDAFWRIIYIIFYLQNYWDCKQTSERMQGLQLQIKLQLQGLIIIAINYKLASLLPLITDRKSVV